MTGTSAAAVRATPGLSALVVYARPAERVRIVACLIGHGLFVSEHDAGGTGIAAAPAALTAHVVVACLADEQATRQGLVEELVATGSFVIAIVPPGSATGWLDALGVGTVVAGDDDTAAIERALKAAGPAVRARMAESLADGMDWRRIFGHLVFRINQPWLRAGAEITALSSTEHGVLNALVAAQGSMVSKLELRRHLGTEDLPASDAYLKTVVLRIRRKVERLGGDSACLVSVRGIGYLLRP